MAKKPSLHDLVRKIRRVPDEEALAAVLSGLAPGAIAGPVRIAFVNAHAVNLCHADPEFLGNLVEADYVFRDGSGMKILFKLLRRNAGLNLNGTDLIPRLIDIYRGKRAAFLGTREPYIRQAAAVAEKRGLDICLAMDGFREAGDYLEAVRNSRPFVIVLGMGMPKQERVAALLARTLDFPCVIVCGGAILDFMGGKVSRAPLVFRRTGMEWLYRLGKEPRRLFRRYAIGNFLFLFRSCHLALEFGRHSSSSE